ncbi:hypothetical protein AWB70_02408 [Caballeronia cordobensis]|uniref:MxaA protein n=1 Tax=Caballeronia cordobensis TaxID=1353886 RepID=A0A158GTE0_CABCO|nr:hypothetical protein [Caballeronia cordobensis]SAL34859.1 hypothetical protein AWB70_02408 [Caballeronia cordobensis]
MKRGCVLVLMALALNGACRADTIVQQPRAFGYVLGDMLTQRVLLSLDGHDLHDVPPPSTGRTGLWLERRQTRIEKDAQGRAWMVIDYQIVNAAQSLTQAEVPAFDLTPATGATLHVPAWPISIGALTPRASFNAGDLQPLRPDRIVLPEPRVDTRRRMFAMLALTAATLTGWMAWWSWRRREDARRLPFARAWESIRKRDAADIDADDGAWVSVHRALDETAGQVVHARSLNELLLRAPWLEALRTQLEAFYAGSQQRFFSRENSSAPFALRAFARALYRAEKKRQ